MNYELIIFCSILICALIVAFDKVLRRFKRFRNSERNAVVENAISFLPILLLVFSLRSFAYEPYRIPSGSLKPTLKVGDFILVNKYQYGIRLPIINKKLVNIGEPKRGDIVVFRSPSKDYPPIMIKRVVGLPGDKIRYINKTLYVNGAIASHHYVRSDIDSDDGQRQWQVAEHEESLSGVNHHIYLIPQAPREDFETTVPKGKYFMMGDNRDDSGDSRYWGALPEENIIGKATRVLFSVDSLSHPVRVERTGMRIV